MVKPLYRCAFGAGMPLASCVFRVGHVRITPGPYTSVRPVRRYLAFADPLASVVCACVLARPAALAFVHYLTVGSCSPCPVVGWSIVDAVLMGRADLVLLANALALIIVH